jgi:alpha-L-fucosidase
MPRGYLFIGCSLVAVVAGLGSSVAAPLAETKYEPNWQSLDRRATPKWFTDAKFGIIIHWGVYSVPAWGPKGKYAEWYLNAMRDANSPTWAFHKRVYGRDFRYEDFAPMFKAELFDPDEWADLFVRSGARYVVLTSKHHDGYCLWPSPHRPGWNSAEVGSKRDLLGELAAAVRKRGLKMGFYYSLYEWTHPLYPGNVKRYVDEYMVPQFKDVVTRYQPSIIFADGEWDHPAATWRSEELLTWLFNDAGCREEVVVNDRWGKDTRHKHGGYWTTEYGAGLAGAERAWEENRGMGRSYGYNRNESVFDYASARELILLLVDTVSRGGNLLLNIGPAADGRIPVIMQERLLQIGDWLKVNGEAIYASRPWQKNCQWSVGQRPEIEYGKEWMAKYDISEITAKPGPEKAVVEAFFTCKADALYAIVPWWPGKMLVLQVPEPSSQARVMLLGRPEPLKWQYMDGKLHIDTSPPQAADLACQWAYSFKITTDTSRQ